MKRTFLFFCFGLSACQIKDECDLSLPKDKRQDCLFRKDAKQLEEAVAHMNWEDQATKNLVEFGTIDSQEIERRSSRLAAKGVNLDSFWLHNGSLLDSPLYRMASDLDWYMTRQHTLKLISMIATYGYPSSDRIPGSKTWNPTFLLEHADYTLRDTIMKLMGYELSMKRIDSNTYELTRWAMSARTILPQLDGIQIVKGDSVIAGKIN